MNEKLANKKCVPCEGGTSPLTEEEAKKLLAQVSANWHLEENSPPHQTRNVKPFADEKISRSGVGERISAEFKFKNFKEAMVFVNKVADIAESEGHHPDIHINYSKVKLELWTHAISGLSINDFILASKVDSLTINKT